MDVRKKGKADKTCPFFQKIKHLVVSNTFGSNFPLQNYQPILFKEKLFHIVCAKKRDTNIKEKRFFSNALTKEELLFHR